MRRRQTECHEFMCIFWKNNAKKLLPFPNFFGKTPHWQYFFPNLTYTCENAKPLPRIYFNSLKLIIKFSLSSHAFVLLQNGIWNVLKDSKRFGFRSKHLQWISVKYVVLQNVMFLKIAPGLTLTILRESSN